jgi:hypothetical protein
VTCTRQTLFKNCVQIDVNECKIGNWKEKSINRADWEKHNKEAKVSIGLKKKKKMKKNRKEEEERKKRWKKRNKKRNKNRKKNGNEEERKKRNKKRN